MSGIDHNAEPAVTPDEEAAARRLADALGGRAGAGADPQALAAVRLIEAARGAASADVVARARLRRRLVAAAGRRRAARAVRWGVAAAAAIAVGAGMLTLLHRNTRVLDLGAREAEARAAVESAWGAANVRTTVSSSLAAPGEAACDQRLLNDLAASSFDQLRRHFLYETTGFQAVAGAPAQLAPTPGGLS